MISPRPHVGKLKPEAAPGDEAERLWAQGARLGVDDAMALALDAASAASGFARRG